MKRGLLRLTALGLLALVLVILLGSSAFAHAAYKFSSPDDESTVASAPTEIWAEYTEPPSAASYLKVFDPCGVQVDNGDSRADAARNRVYITQSANRAGSYRVEWFVDSEVDAHSTRGTFTFTVTSGTQCPGAAEEPVEREPRERDPDPSRKDRSSDPENGVEEGSDMPAAPAGGGGGHSGRHQQHNKPGEQKRRERRADPDENDTVAADNPSPGDTAAPEEPGLLSDIPIGGLVIALAMTAAIGAAGGFIYAGIMGYHRVSN